MNVVSVAVGFNSAGQPYNLKTLQPYNLNL